jgi:methionine synthase I (cobalamin-dependent)
MELLEALASRVVVADGAMGTLLHARGAKPGTCLEDLCITQPEMVSQVHRDYLAAGAQLIRTHSFGSNAARLAQWGFERRVGELNWTAARIAREAAKGTHAMVAASVGPTGCGREAGPLLEEQIGALLDGGAQCVIFETFTDIEELLVALEAKQSLHHCPAVAMIAGMPSSSSSSLRRLSVPRAAQDDEGEDEDENHEFSAVWTRLRDGGADVVGVNCIGTPRETLAALGGADLSESAAFPSAGLPDPCGRHALSAAHFAEGAHALVERGVRLIGGCCGTTPEHIAALTARLSPAA